MNNKISQPELAAIIAMKTGSKKSEAENFVREFFSLVAETLEQGDHVKVKGFGTFKLTPIESRKSVNIATGETMQIPGHRRIVFVPSKELAASVNLPFEAFEVVELSDAVTDFDLEAGEIPDTADTHKQAPDGSVATTASEQMQPAETPQTDSTAHNTEVSDNDTDTDTGETDIMPSEPSLMLTAAEPVCKQSNHDTQSSRPDATEKDNQNHNAEEAATAQATSKRRKGFGIGFLAGCITGIVISAAFVIGFYLCAVHRLTTYDKNDGQAVVTDVKPLPVETDSANAATSEPDKVAEEKTQDTPVETADTKPSDEPVYDTISHTRFLTTMAKEHYGNYNLWPYIYEENKDILGHPDRIRPGTRVVIPSLQKYGIDPSNKDDIAKAKRKGVEIYSRYK